MTWTGKTFNVGDILTAAQMNNLQADITAQAQGDAGAPAQAVATLTNSVTTATSSAEASLVLPPGLYNLQATLQSVGGGSGKVQILSIVNGISTVIMGTASNVGESVGGTFLCVNSGSLQVNNNGTGGFSYTYERYN